MFPNVPPRAYDWLLALQPALSTPSAEVDALEDGASDRCLLITDAYGRLMQFVLALTALVVLFIKRKLETPMRPLKVWALDVGKQCCGAFLVHCLSILLSILFVAEAARGDDECGLYFVGYMLDTTCGVVVLLCLLQLQQTLAEKFAWRDLVESGFYGDPPRLAVWAKQVAAYACAVLVMKLLISAVILWYYDSIAAFATALFSSFTEHRHLELLLVMIIIPGCCNSFQFWIVDSYLKCDGSHWKYFATFITSDDEQQQQPLTKVTTSSLDEQHETTNLLSDSHPPLMSLGSSGAVKHVVSYDTACETTPLTDSKAAATRPGSLL